MYLLSGFTLSMIFPSGTPFSLHTVTQTHTNLAAAQFNHRPCGHRAAPLDQRGVMGLEQDYISICNEGETSNYIVFCTLKCI